MKPKYQIGDVVIVKSGGADRTGVIVGYPNLDDDGEDGLYNVKILDFPDTYWGMPKENIIKLAGNALGRLQRRYAKV